MTDEDIFYEFPQTVTTQDDIQSVVTEKNKKLAEEEDQKQRQLAKQQKKKEEEYMNERKQREEELFTMEKSYKSTYNN